MKYKHTPERMKELCKSHESFVNSLENKQPLVLQETTEIYSFLTEDNVLYAIHLSYIFTSKGRCNIESLSEGNNYHVTGLFWIPNESYLPIEVEDYEEIVDRANEFMELKFKVKDCYTKYDFGYEDDEEEEDPVYGNNPSDNPDPVDHENGHYL